MPLPFDPQLFVGREPELAQLIGWAITSNPDHRLMTVAAPPGYGKSWLMQELERRLRSRPDLFIIRVPTLELNSPKDIAAWLQEVIGQAQKVCPNVRNSGSTTSIEASISQLLEDLCENRIPKLRPILIIDGFDERLRNERDMLEKYLLEQFWRNECTRVVVAFRDELALSSHNLRRGEERMHLDVFTPNSGQEQLQKQAQFKRNTSFSPQDLMFRIPSYQWTHPEINSNLYELAEQKMARKQPLSFTASELRRSWVSLIEKKSKQEVLTLETIEPDLKTMARHSEDTWMVRTFGKRCGCSENEAHRRIEKLMVLSLVINEQFRFKIVDGIREIVRAELALEEQESSEKEEGS